MSIVLLVIHKKHIVLKLKIILCYFLAQYESNAFCLIRISLIIFDILFENKSTVVKVTLGLIFISGEQNVEMIILELDSIE